MEGKVTWVDRLKTCAVMHELEENSLRLAEMNTCSWPSTDLELALALSMDTWPLINRASSDDR
jgi:hypothetical protein